MQTKKLKWTWHKNEGKYCSFDYARHWCSANDIRGSLDYNAKRSEYYKRIEKDLKETKHELPLPKNPRATYRLEWKGWNHFCMINLVSFKVAKQIVNYIGIKTRREFVALRVARKLRAIPGDPPGHYRKNWKGWNHFLNTPKILNKNRKENFLPFEQAKQIVHGLKLRSSLEYRRESKINPLLRNIPRNPEDVYGRRVRNR